MLLELAIGDAYGAGFEYVDKETVARLNDLSAYRKHPRHDIYAGQYTDDTQMSLAIAEMIADRRPWTPIALADAFVEVFKRDERTGYSQNFQAFLESVSSGEEFLAKIKPDSDKSGAAMRAVPIGIFASESKVLEYARIQAMLTHDTASGIASAQASALMSHYFLYERGPKSEVGAYLERLVPGEWDAPYREKVRAKGWMSVCAAVTAIKASSSMSELLKTCIALTGDVDTVATIALGCAASCAEITQDLPQQLIDTLENGKYGRDYLVALDARLMALKNSL